MPQDYALSALKKAETIGAGPSPWQETANSVITNAVGGLKGLLGFEDDSTGNHIGQLLAAGAPLLAPHPAISELLKTLSAAPEEINATKLIANDKLGGWTPHRSMIVAPEGFELPSGTSAFIDRDPALSDRYVQEQWRNADRPQQLPPSRIPPLPANKRMSPLDLLKGFDSKFVGSGY